MDRCTACGMPVSGAAEYHPYTACLMFMACHNSKTVWANLQATVEYGMKTESAGLSADNTMHNTCLLRESVPEKRSD